jgi:hypothetical protein
MGQWMADHAAAIVAVGLLLLLVILPVAIFLWMTAVPAGSPSTAPATPRIDERLLASRLRAHVETIASEPHNMANPEALERAAVYLEERLEETGYAVRRQEVLDGARNLEVVIEPRTPTAPTLIVGAHYDSALGTPGANDNATGAAAVVELARLLSDLRGKARVRIRLALFVNEEPPHFMTEGMGSLVYAKALRRGGEPVDAMFSLETIGYYSNEGQSQRYPFPLNLRYPSTGNFIAFVATVKSRSLVRRAVGEFRSHSSFPSVGGSAPQSIPGIAWSDHWAFEQQGYPALMITDTAPFRYPHYHLPSDTPDKVQFDRLARLVAGLEATIRNWKPQ